MLINLFKHSKYISLKHVFYEIDHLGNIQMQGKGGGIRPCGAKLFFAILAKLRPIYLTNSCYIRGTSAAKNLKAIDFRFMCL